MSAAAPANGVLAEVASIYENVRAVMAGAPPPHGRVAPR